MSVSVQRPNAARPTAVPVVVKPPPVSHFAASQILPLHALYVDPNCQDSGKYEVYGENEKYSVLLTRRWTWENVSYIILQTLKAVDSSHYGTYTRFGFSGEVGKTRLEKFDTADEAVAQFCELFKAATGNRWAGDITKCLQSDNYNEGKYILLSAGSSDELMTSGNVPFDVKHVAKKRTKASKPKDKVKPTNSIEDAKKTAATAKTSSNAPASDVYLADVHLASQVEPPTHSKVQLLNDLFASEIPVVIDEDMLQSDDYLRSVDCVCPNRDMFEVVIAPSGDPYTVVLEKLDSEADAPQQSTFALIQLLRMKDVEGSVFCFSRWGWFDTEGEHMFLELESLEDAVAEFERQFLETSGVEWHGSLSNTAKQFSAGTGKFTLLDGFVWESMCKTLVQNMGTSNIEPMPLTSAPDPADLTQSPRGVEEPEEEISKTKAKSSKDRKGKGKAEKADKVQKVDKVDKKEKAGKADKKEKVKAKSKKTTVLEIDEGVEDKEGVVVIWSVKLAQKNGKRFYILQLLEKTTGDSIEQIVHARVFKDGAAGVSVTKAFANIKIAKAAFCKKFEGKTENKWLKDFESTEAAFIPGEGEEVFVLVGEQP